MPPNFKCEMKASEDLDSYFSHAFNPPQINGAQSESAFNEEYRCTYDTVKCEIESLGGVCDPVQGNFAMNETHGVSRWIAVELINNELISPRLLPAISNALKQQRHDYVVYLSHECPEEPLFHLLLFKDHLFHTPSESVWLSSLLEEMNPQANPVTNSRREPRA